MESEFSAAGVRVVELPKGEPIAAESYGEFAKALNAFQDTKAFSAVVKEKVESGLSPIFYVAGETDLKYFQTAAILLDKPHLTEYFNWIGADSLVGGGKFTGDSAMDHAIEMFRANPELAGRKIVFLYDCDANKKDETFDTVTILALEQVPGAKCEKGIENLLPDKVFTEEMYEKKEKTAGYGRMNVIWNLKKMKLCDSLCGPQSEKDTFLNFASILDRLDEITRDDTRIQT